VKRSKQVSENNVEGSYFVRAKPSGKWYVFHQTYSEGKPTQKSIPTEAYETLGFQKHWNVIQAKAFCSELNKEKPKEKQTIRRAAQKADEIIFVNQDFFPDQLCHLFRKKLNSSRYQLRL